MTSHGIENEKILAQFQDAATLSFAIPASSDFFDGHFPQYKLLPGVAQVELVTRFAHKYLNTGRNVTKIKRVKFAAPIRPDTTVTLVMEYNEKKQSVSYSLSDTNESERIYSSGSFLATRIS